jgi:hypothetical protein
MADSTPTMADGLLGWPGFGPGGSQQFKAVRLFTGDIWYAPRSGFYFIIGAGGGGGGASFSTGGGSGGTLFFYPLYIPEGVGGVVKIGLGGAGSANGTGTSLGKALVLGGGFSGLVVGAPSGLISGTLLSERGRILSSQGTSGDLPAGAQILGGTGGFCAAELTNSLVDDIDKGRIRMAKPGVASGSASELCGAGGSAGGASGQPGADGGLIIAWVGAL